MKLIINSQCDSILSKADEHNLQLEVVWSAFKHKEQFPMPLYLNAYK
jgi:hypothetical protein